jgi:hypothetical protein
VTLKTQSAASKLPNAPSRQYLSKASKQDTRPAYFYDDDGSLKIDIDHPDWLEMLERRSQEKQTYSSKGVRNSDKLKQYKETKTVHTENKFDIETIHAESLYAKAKQEILKAEQLEYKNEIDRLKLERAAMNLIEYNLAEYAFLSYMDKVNLGMLRMVKKLKPIIVNLCAENEPTRILELIQQETEQLIITVKDQQKKAIEDWVNDQG